MFRPDNTARATFIPATLNHEALWRLRDLNREGAAAMTPEDTWLSILYFG